MEKADKDKIMRSLSVLVSKTIWSQQLENRLLEKKEENGGASRLQRLYMEVQKRGPNAFRGLVRCLVESENFEAANILDESIQVPKQQQQQPATRQQKVWNEPTYEIPPPLDLPVNFHPAQLVDERTPVMVKVRKATVWKGPPQFKAYSMNRNPRGFALIIDNEEFAGDIMPRREGSLIDANNLDILLEELYFKVTLRRNLCYNDLLSEITNFARLPELAEADMVVVAILSHGDSGLIFAQDGRKVPTEWLLRQFNNDGCPALKGKPKFFILQACRGDEPDYGFVPRIDTSESSPTATDAQCVASPRLSVDSVSDIKDPTWEDMLIAYATIPGYVANRNCYRGTWFIESICRVFMERACDMDIREMLDEVSENMRYYESEHGTKQSCSYEVRHFYKKLYFNPGLTRQSIEVPNKEKEEKLPPVSAVVLESPEMMQKPRKCFDY